MNLLFVCALGTHHFCLATMRPRCSSTPRIRKHTNVRQCLSHRAKPLCVYTQMLAIGPAGRSYSAFGYAHVTTPLVTSVKSILGLILVVLECITRDTPKRYMSIRVLVSLCQSWPLKTIHRMTFQSEKRFEWTFFVRVGKKKIVFKMLVW